MGSFFFYLGRFCTGLKKLKKEVDKPACVSYN